MDIRYGADGSVSGCVDSSFRWEMEGDGRSLAFLAFDPQGAAAQFHQIKADVKT